YPACDVMPDFYRAFYCLKQLVRLAVINECCTHLMHRLRGWLCALDEILFAAVTAVSKLPGAAVNIDGDHTRWWRQRLFRYTFQNGFHVSIPGWLRTLRAAFITGNLIFNRARGRGAPQITTMIVKADPD